MIPVTTLGLISLLTYVVVGLPSVFVTTPLENIM